MITYSQSLHAALLSVDMQRVVWWPGVWGPKQGWQSSNPLAPEMSTTRQAVLTELNLAGLITVDPHQWLGYRPRPVRCTPAGKAQLLAWTQAKAAAA